MSGICPRTCGNCGNYSWFAVDYGEHPEDDCGSCKATGDIVYSDDEGCDKWFASGKKMRIKEPKKNKAKHSKKMRCNDDDWN